MNDDEEVYFVDKNDTVIRKGYRSEFNDSLCWRIVSIWITNDKGEILLQRRKHDKKIMPDVWTAATEGTVTYGDDYEQTAIKELSEEISLTGVKLAPGKKYYGRWGNIGSRQCQSYFATFNGTVDQLKPQEDEVAELRWFTEAQVKQMHKNNPELFPLYEQYRFFEFIS